MRCTISQIYFGKELCMFRTDLLSIIRSLKTVYTEVDIFHASASVSAQQKRVHIIIAETERRQWVNS